MSEPRYVALHERGELRERAQAALERLGSCDICPRECHKDRASGELGDCEVGRAAQVASSNLHFGEENPLFKLPATRNDESNPSAPSLAEGLLHPAKDDNVTITVFGRGNIQLADCSHPPLPDIAD